MLLKYCRVSTNKRNRGSHEQIQCYRDRSRFCVQFWDDGGQHLSKDAYKAEKDRIEREYKAEKARCDSLAENAKDICLIEAKGRGEVAEADLQARYEPSKENRDKARAVKAEADYAAAKERCDDRAGNAKDICLKEAKAVEASRCKV